MNPQATRENCAILCGGMGEYFYVPTRTLGDKLPSQKPSINDVLNHLYTTTYGPKILKSLNAKDRKRNKMLKGGKFLKKLWCCVGGGVLQDNLVLSTGLIM